MSQADLKTHTILKESKAKQLCMFAHGSAMSISQIRFTSTGKYGANIPRTSAAAQMNRMGKFQPMVRMSVNNYDGDLSKKAEIQSSVGKVDKADTTDYQKQGNPLFQMKQRNEKQMSEVTKNKNFMKMDVAQKRKQVMSQESKIGLQNTVNMAQSKQVKSENKLLKNVSSGLERAKNMVQKEIVYSDQWQQPFDWQSLLAQQPNYQVNMDGTISQNSNHFDNVFKFEPGTNMSAGEKNKDLPARSVDMQALAIGPHPLYEESFGSVDEVVEVINKEQHEEHIDTIPVADMETHETIEKDVWDEPIDPKHAKALKAMTMFTKSYLKNTDTKLCVDLSVSAVVLKGLANHKVTLGAPLCPCRHYDDPAAEVKDGYWNCPCKPMRDHKECHCMLFLTEDSDFVGEDTAISVEQVLELTKGQ